MPFKKGQSGNPRGRPLGAKSKVPTVEEVDKLIMAHTPDAIKKIIDLCNNGASENIQLKAAVTLMTKYYDIVVEESSVKVSKNKTKDNIDIPEDEKNVVLFSPKAVSKD